MPSHYMRRAGLPYKVDIREEGMAKGAPTVVGWMEAIKMLWEE